MQSGPIEELPELKVSQKYTASPAIKPSSNTNQSMTGKVDTYDAYYVEK